MSERAVDGRKVKMTPDELAGRIRDTYNTVETPFSFISGGLRRIAVDHADRRAQMKLLRFGQRYHSKVQLMVYELNRLFQPDVFVDVGSNYGECLFSLPLNARTPVIGFEANPVLLPFLERSKSYNDDLTVELIGKAVGPNGADGSISFFVNPRWSGRSTASRAAVAEGMKEISVPLTSVDREVSARFPDARSVVMKVDVEGFEPQVLAGSTAIIAQADFFVCLLEFDDTFLEGGDAGARAFFNKLAEQFDVYLTGRTIERVASYDVLSRRAKTKAGNIHCDLLLLKASGEQHALFEKRFRGATTQAIAAEVWALPSS